MRQGTCKHFNGIQRKTCKAGISYDSFRVEGKSMLKTMPCMNKCLSCDKREFPTQVEIDAYEVECEKAMQPVLALDAAISSGEKSGSFVHEACGGTIHWTYSGPLAMRAKCDGCDWSGMS